MQSETNKYGAKRLKDKCIKCRKSQVETMMHLKYSKHDTFVQMPSELQMCCLLKPLVTSFIHTLIFQLWEPPQAMLLRECFRYHGRVSVRSG